MQTDNRLLDDLARIATGALGTLHGAREEIESAFRRQFERILDDMDVVTREEFDVVKAMAAEARAENEAQARRIAALETAAGSQPAKKRRAGTATRSKRSSARTRKPAAQRGTARKEQS